MIRRFLLLAATACLVAGTAAAELRFDAPDTLSWDVEADATAWEIARATAGGFAGCAALPTAAPTLVDPTAPPSGATLFYLERAVAPVAGDWGVDSSGAPREVACACSAWIRTYGGADEELLRAAVPYPDGGLVLGGSTRSFNAGAGDRDAWIVRVDAAGDIVWQKRVGAPGTEVAEALAVTPTGDVVVAGETLAENAIVNWNLALALLDADTGAGLGVLEIGDALEDRGRALAATADGGAVLLGHSRATDPFSFDLVALRFDRNGAVVRQSLVDGGGTERAYALTPLDDGGFLVAADTTSYGAGDFDVWILELEKDLTLRRSVVLQGSGFERPAMVRPLGDGGAIVVGGTESFAAAGRDAWVVRLDADLGIVWQRRYGDAGFDEAFDVRPTADGFLVAGRTDAGGTDDVWLLRIDAAGAVLDDRRFGGAGADAARVLAPTAAGGFWVVGDTDSFGAGGRDAWVLKVEADGSVDVGCGLSAPGASTAADTDAVALVPSPVVATPGVVPLDSSVAPVDTDGTAAQQCVASSCTP